MSNKQFDLLVFIGRFQPFSKAHEHVINEALKLSNKVLILVGSSYQARSTRNPFTFDERAQMIRGVFLDTDKIKILPLRDYPYNMSAWLNEAHRQIDTIARNGKIGLIGYAKDHTSFYLKLFPKFESVSVDPFIDTRGKPLSATEIREQYFMNDGAIGFNTVPDHVRFGLYDFKKLQMFSELSKEFAAIYDYKKMWSDVPFPPTFNTVDAVVVQAGHVLLIKRGDYPGKGLWALPGGFINEYEDLDDAVLRELREETTIDVPPAILRKIMSAPVVFSAPYRSTRGRTITYAYLFDLDSEIDRNTSRNMPIEKSIPKLNLPIGLTKVKGADDAIDAQWVKLSDIHEDEMFEDHYSIIFKMLETK